MIINKLYRLLSIIIILSGITVDSKTQPVFYEHQSSDNHTQYFYQDTLIRINDYEVTSSVYLPAGYKKTKRNSLIMILDWRNSSDLMNKSISDSLDSFAKRGNPSAVVFVVKKISVGPGKNELTDSAIIAFITKYLKPFIVKHFHGAGETSVVAGIGNTASLAMRLKVNYPQFFNRAGIFIPEFDSSSDIPYLIDSNATNIKGMIFIHSFKKDTSENGRTVNKCLAVLGKNSPALLYNLIENRQGETNLQYCFLEFYKWILSDGNNYIISPPKKQKSIR